jgi:predicted transposase/invertase (TIGR01784 family)
MDEKPLNQPHDKLFKATFSKLENAQSFLQGVLPQQVLPQVAWNSLRLLPATFIDPRFQNSESDLLHSDAIRGTQVLLYLLLEHQSSEDPRMAIRSLCYVVRIWETFAGANPPRAKLPPFIRWW